MLIRLFVKNLFSFNKLTEFNLLPGKGTRLSSHIIKKDTVPLLKLSCIYGANGAGKSNLIRSLYLLKSFVTKGKMPNEFNTETFKFNNESPENEVYMGVEFIKDESVFYYGLTIKKGIIIEEELLLLDALSKQDTVLFTRKDNSEKNELVVEFNPDIIGADSEAALFPSFLKNELLERNKPVLFYLKNRKNSVFSIYKKVFEWIAQDLIIIDPNAKPASLIMHIEENPKFYDFSCDMMKAFKTGIKKILVDTSDLEKYFGQDKKSEIEEIRADLRTSPTSVRIGRNREEEFVIALEEDNAIVKTLKFLHEEDNGNVTFTSSEESDGTRRLLDFLPAIYQAIYEDTVIVIDEIERSLHPLLIKEIIEKFSSDSSTKGQLIFSTHESYLLDQKIFRPDEIWFAEKNLIGETELYPLSEFKEHHTIDIQKGYLSGRYGAIPFLGNLEDLNWTKYA